jgi:hypothetical protein
MAAHGMDGGLEGHEGILRPRAVKSTVHPVLKARLSDQGLKANGSADTQSGYSRCAQKFQLSRETPGLYLP